jgi:hypothetical protein
MSGYFVKPLEWRFWPNGFPPFWAGTAGKFGYYSIEEAAPSDEDEDQPEDARPVFRVTDMHHNSIGVKRDIEAAQALAQSHFDALVRGVITNEPR